VVPLVIKLVIPLTRMLSHIRRSNLSTEVQFLILHKHIQCHQQTWVLLPTQIMNGWIEPQNLVQLSGTRSIKFFWIHFTTTLQTQLLSPCSVHVCTKWSPNIKSITLLSTCTCTISFNILKSPSRTGSNPIDCLPQLLPTVSFFLVTFQPVLAQ